MSDTQAVTNPEEDFEVACAWCSAMGGEDEIKRSWEDMNGDDVSFYTRGENPTAISLCFDCFAFNEEENAVAAARSDVQRWRDKR